MRDIIYKYPAFIMYKHEIWKPVLGYEGLYEISNLGRVKSLNYNHTGKEQILKQKLNKFNRLNVTLYKHKKQKMHQVHRLVWEAFNGEIPTEFQINHIDENPKNNDLNNLNLMTPKENSNWGTHIERVAQKTRKKIQQFDLNGNLVTEFSSLTEASEHLNMGYKACGNISNCLKGRYRHAYGFIWKYKTE